MGLEAFDHILLQDTFVLAWRELAGELVFEVDAGLSQTHPESVPPKAGEWACYRSATIRFVGVTAVSGLLPMESVKPAISSDGTIDYGCIDRLSASKSGGEYCISGEFGDVSIVASGVKLEWTDITSRSERA